MKLVVDCNVVISAAITNGICRKALLKATNEYQIVVSEQILQEYTAVAQRKKFQKHKTLLNELINIIETSSIIVEDLPSNNIVLPDQDDLIYLDACLNSNAKYLVTGNIKDFPEIHYHGVEVVTPREFINI